MFSANRQNAVSSYQRINVETGMGVADQHQLVSLLFDGFLASVSVARGALARKDVPAKCAAVAKAQKILQEGLMSGLDTIDGGELAANLEALYDYTVRRLIFANSRDDDAIFQEVQGLIEPIAESWKQIKGNGTAYLRPM